MAAVHSIGRRERNPAFRIARYDNFGTVPLMRMLSRI
jgi:hypothetical protein